MNEAFTSSKVGKYFKIEERKSCFTREFRAATTTFLSIVYVITVISTVLASTGGPCSHSSEALEYKNCVLVVQSDLIVAVSLASMLGCFAMGLLANLPLGVAPGSGQAMYMAYNLVGLNGSGPMKYSEALGLWMVEALVFLVISGSGLRAKMGRLIPPSVRLACAVGIGLFIAFVGLQSEHGVGLIGPDMKMKSLNSPTFWLGVVGFIIMCYGMAHEVKGSMIYGILFVTLISWFRSTSVTYFPKTVEGEVKYLYFRKVVDFHKIQKIAGKISFKDFSKGRTWVSLFILVYIDILATTGTLYTLVEIGGFIDNQGSFENEYIAYMVDALVTVVGSALGISPVSTAAESSTGIKEGGRTGLTAVIIGLYFSLSLVFAPLLTSVPPWAIGPSLVMVGVIMMKVAKDIDWGNIKEAVPAFITIILMPLTSSIPNGIIGGLGIYVVLNFYGWISWMVKVVVMKKPKIKNPMQIEANEIGNQGAIP
ncbi:Adenine/guanine permease AZG2 [Bienertia sinuspersici]